VSSGYLSSCAQCDTERLGAGDGKLMAKEDWWEIIKFKEMLLIVSNSQAIRRFNINSNEYLEYRSKEKRNCVRYNLDFGIAQS